MKTPYPAKSAAETNDSAQQDKQASRKAMGFMPG
jgi:hypothetical protein